SLIRLAAAEALLRIEPKHDRAAKVLLGRLERETPGGLDLRLRAAVVLSKSGRYREQVSNVIDALANDDYASVRSVTLETIEELDLELDVKLKLLCKGLQDQRAFVRQMAAEQLGKLGVHAKVAEKELRAMSEDPDLFVRLQAGSALKRVRGK